MPAVAIATALTSRLADLISQYGTTVTLKQAGSGATVTAVPTIIELASASDHTAFFTSTILDTFTRPLWTLQFAGALPQFGGTTALTTNDFITMPVPGSGGSPIDYSVRSILFQALGSGSPIRTLILVSL
jgi:hypothetical protein